LAIKFDGDTEYTGNLTVGHSGILNLFDNYKINDIKFVGLRMTKTDFNRQGYLDPWEYVLDDSAVYEENIDEA
jgi:hypothetical protein